MTEQNQNTEYTRLLEEAHKLDNEISTVTSALSRYAKDLVTLGMELQQLGTELQSNANPKANAMTIAANFDYTGLQESASAIAGLLHQLSGAFTGRTDIEARLAKFSRHQAR